MSNTQRKQFGAVVVEFALVVPLLIVLVFGITELGRAMYQLNTLTKSTSAGARYLARLHDAVIVGDGSCTKGTAWDVDKASKIVKYGNEQGAPGDELIPNVTVTFELHMVPDDVFDDDVTRCFIRAISSADYTSVFGDLGPIIPFTDIDAITMQQTVDERYIGE